MVGFLRVALMKAICRHGTVVPLQSVTLISTDMERIGHRAYPKPFCQRERQDTRYKKLAVVSALLFISAIAFLIFELIQPTR